MLQRLLREPLLHFALLGLALFALYTSLNPQELVAPDEIVIDAARVAALTTRFASVWRRPPTDEELEGLLESWVREEVLYREGLALGLAEDDPVVRSHIARQTAFLNVVQTPVEPDEAALQAWLDAHPDDYVIPAMYSFEQLFLGPAGEAAEQDSRISVALQALQAGESVPVPADSRNMLPRSLSNAPEFEVSRAFGRAFVNALPALPLGEWAGPIATGQGLHLVRVAARSAARPARLEEVRVAVESDYIQAQQDRLDDDRYQAMRARYTIRVAPGVRYVTGEEPSQPETKQIR